MTLLALAAKEFFTFQAEFGAVDVGHQRQEIVITRSFDPRPTAWRFHQGTWIFRDELRDEVTANKINSRFKLNVGIMPDWSKLKPLLKDSRLALAELEWKTGRVSTKDILWWSNDNTHFRYDDLEFWGNASQMIAEPLVALLKDGDSIVRARAATALGKLAKGDAVTVGSLVLLLKDRDSNVRACAAEALGKLAKIDTNVIQPLVALLQDEDGYTRLSAAEALRRLSRNNEAIETLVELLRDEHEDICVLAANALFEIANADADAIEILLTLITKGYSGLYPRVVEALTQKGQRNAKLTGRLVSFLKSEDIDIRAVSAEVLGELGSNDAGVIESLVVLLDDRA